MRKQNLPSYTFNEKSYYSHLSLSVVTLILFIFFIITVGPQFLEGDFTAYSTLSGYFLQLLQCSFLLCSLIFFKYYKYQKNKIIYYLITIGYIFLFISIGDRGPALYLICVILGLFTFYIRKIRLVILLPLAIFGVLTMHFVGIGRTTDVSDQGNIVSRALENNDSNNFIELMYSSTESFVVNSRNLYVGLDYVDENGINMGETMFKSLIAVIPFGQAFIQGLTNKTLYNSAEFFTILNFGPNYPYGLGTNLVADVYISFGVLGIIILFFLFGFIVEYSRTKTISNTGLISSIVYFFFIYFSIYFPRTDYFFALKYIVWTILIFYILKILKILNRRNIT